MALYRENPPNVFRLWTGEKIADVRHPPEIEAAWTTVELEALKLFIPAAAAAVPDGKVSIGQSVRRVDGAVRYVHDLVDMTPEQIAERDRIAAQQAEFDAAKLDAWIIAFLGMTPAGAQAYVENNSATLAALRTNVARLAYAVRVLTRRGFNV